MRSVAIRVLIGLAATVGVTLTGSTVAAAATPAPAHVVVATTHHIGVGQVVHRVLHQDDWWW